MSSSFGDALTVGILLTLIFGAVCFYIYSRMTQNEKRVGLLENLLLQLKMNTEASLEGPESVQPVSGPAPLAAEDVDGVEETEYSELLKEVAVSRSPVSRSPVSRSPVAADGSAEEDLDEEAAAEEVLARIPSAVPQVNYESMTVKELTALAKERGLSGVPQRKKELIDALKRQGGAPPAAPLPLVQVDGELEGAELVEGAALE